MPTKTIAPRGPKSAAGPTFGHHAPWGTAALMGAALSCGLWSLVKVGRVPWPPTQLLADTYTLAGCLALVGPILLRRKRAGELGVGDLIWMIGGLLVWVFDAAAVARGEARTLAWATPLGQQSLGLIVLAVAVAAWRGRAGGGQWTWTNVTGWALGIFWVALAGATLVPPRTLGLALR